MAGHFEHERQRLLKLVDQFIEEVEDQWDAEDAPRLDSPAIVAMIEYNDPEESNDDDAKAAERAVPFWFSETRRKHVLLGVIDSIQQVIRGGLMQLGMTSDDDGDDDARSN